MINTQHGGAREGAGRKTKAEEMGLPMLIEDCIGKKGKKALISKLYTRAAEDGDIKAIALLMAYIFGKPVDIKEIDLTSNGEQLQQITGIKIT